MVENSFIKERNRLYAQKIVEHRFNELNLKEPRLKRFSVSKIKGLVKRFEHEDARVKTWDEVWRE